MIRKLIIIGVLLGLANCLPTSTVSAATGSISYDSFTGIYHLSRDNRGLSLLTTEETVVANFPARGYSGITRAIPTKFQGHSVNVKVLNVTDAAGNTVPFKTKNDAGNILVVTGDPDITVSGSQTIKIRYQTKGVIDLGKNADQLLLDVNGRGWDSLFNKVDAVLYMSANFQARIKGNQSCYLSIGSANTDNCVISASQTSQGTVVTAKAREVAAHQALIMKVAFEPATFTNDRGPQVILLAAAALLTFGLVLVFYRQYRSPKRPEHSPRPQPSDHDTHK
jgi:hypothetical protein